MIRTVRNIFYILKSSLQSLPLCIEAGGASTIDIFRISVGTECLYIDPSNTIQRVVVVMADESSDDFVVELQPSKQIAQTAKSNLRAIGNNTAAVT
jgi:hypothetical protein